MEYIEIKKCRACLTEEGAFQSVFVAESNSGLSLHISEMMNACAAIQVTAGDGLPEQICTQCARETVKMFLFKLKCEKSDMILKAQLKELSVRYEDNLFNKVLVKPEIEGDNSYDSQENAPLNGDSLEINLNENNNEKMFSEAKKKDFECDICQEIFNQEDLLFRHKLNHSMKIEYEDSSEVNHNSVTQLDIKEEELSFHDVERDNWFVEKNDLAILDGSSHIKNITKASSKEVFSKEELTCHFDPYRGPSGEKEEAKVSPVLFIDLAPVEDSNQKSNLNNHEKFQNDEKPFSCLTCGKAFKGLENLKQHQKRHAEYKKHLCGTCGKGYSSKSELDAHLRWHTGEKPFVCLTCNRGFTSCSSLINHKRTHSGEKPHECDLCKKKFLRSEQLAVHKRIHTGEKPFKCDVCKKSFSNAHHLARHKRTHTGEKPYDCDTCGVKFQRTEDLAAHKRMHLGVKQHECKLCKKDFSSSGVLLRHKMQFHLGEKHYQCEICMKKFTSMGNLANHRRTHTGEKPYVCKLCPKAFSQSSNLRKHLRIHNRK